jgi:hypothetical protein
MDHATRVSFQLLNVNAHTITRSKFRSFKETRGLMNKPGLAFVSTSRHTNFWTLARVLLYGHVVHTSSRSLVHVRWHECVATVGNFYTEDAMHDLSDHLTLINFKQLMTTKRCMFEHIHLDNNTFSILFL